jgi:acetyltransferase-like isoleucine patch superfamily enzyme
MRYISPRAIIEDGTYIGNNVTILGECLIEKGTIIEDNCVIGKPSRSQIKRFQEQLQRATHPLDQSAYDAVIDTPTRIGANSYLQHGTIIYSGVILGEDCTIEDNGVVRWDSTIGAHTKLMMGAIIASYIKIGTHCRVGGILGNDTVLGNYVTNFGFMMHAYREYGGGRREAAPIVHDHVTIGYGAKLIGGVEIGQGSYLAAGCTVTKNVPEYTLVKNVNEFYPLHDWQGSLKDHYSSSFPDQREG